MSQPDDSTAQHPKCSIESTTLATDYKGAVSAKSLTRFARVVL